MNLDQTKENLTKNSAHIATIVDIADEAIICIDETQRIILYNKGAGRIFGYDSDEVIGQSIDILLPNRFRAIHRDHIAEFAKSNTTSRLMGERQQIVGCRKSGREFPAEASISKIEADNEKIFTVVLRDISDRKQLELEQEKFIKDLKVLNGAARAITAELSLEQVLLKIVQTARPLVEAKYAALGVLNDQGHLSRFIADGISQADQAKIGALPTGRGLLGVFLHQGKSMIVNDISSHSSSVGFPHHHPIMHNLLGVPIFSKDKLIGALYLTDKVDGSEFNETDQQLIETLAYSAAIAIENARLYQQTQRLAVLEERERFARDLHDGIIQSIYGVGLSLDNARAFISASNHAAREQIDLSLRSLAQVITDVRNYIFDLRPQALKDKNLRTRLEGLIRELKLNTKLSIKAEVDSNINTHLNSAQASHFFHIAHEALANAVRHAGARNIYLSLKQADDRVTLKVEDDGIGFKMSSQIDHGHRGLANIQTRVKELGAKLEIDSVARQGTRLTVTLRCNAIRD